MLCMRVKTRHKTRSEFMNARFSSPLDSLQILTAAPGLLPVLAPDRPRFTIFATTNAYLDAAVPHHQRSEPGSAKWLTMMPKGARVSGSAAVIA